MLPAPRRDRPSLADVLASCLAAVCGETSRLDLPSVPKAVVVLVDGLGAAALTARGGHARTLSAALSKASTIESGFPTTTASALASLTTGLLPGEHGLVGYSVLDPANDRVLNQLSGWDAAAVPEDWQPQPTLFELAARTGLDAVVIAPERYRDSGFSRAILRGARYLGAQSIDDRIDVTLDWLREPGEGVAYLYVPELDSTAHALGWESEEWTRKLEQLDSAVARLTAGLTAKRGILLTADHGILDIPDHGVVYVDASPSLLEGVRHLAGEPRCLQLHLEPGTDAAAVAANWSAQEGERAWIATRDEAIAADWFGPVLPAIAPRIGDVLVAARKSIAYYDSRVTLQTMVGHHGSFAAAELRVPLLRFGAFAK